MADKLNIDQMLEESRGMQGALGILAYGVLKGLQAGGAKDELLASMRVLMHEHFQRLSDADANALCDVVYRRLSDENRKGKWY